MQGKSARLLFRLNTIDEDFAEATKAALVDLSDYKVSLSCHPVPKSSNPNWALALGDRALCERLIVDTKRKSIIPAFVFDWPREVGLHCGADGQRGLRCRQLQSHRTTVLYGLQILRCLVPEFVRVLNSVGILVGKIGIE